jgi:hypothetical protein
MYSAAQQMNNSGGLEFNGSDVPTAATIVTAGNSEGKTQAAGAGARRLAGTTKAGRGAAGVAVGALPRRPSSERGERCTKKRSRS